MPKANFPAAFPVTRRNVLAAGAVSATAASVGGASVARAQAGPATPPPETLAVAMTINGERRSMEIDTRTTLLDALREHLHLTGTKKGCDHGQCGACTVMVGGRRINSCMTLAVMHEDDSIITIEGLGTPEQPHPLQAAFVKHDGFQCGYCTPGQICSAVAMLAEIKAGVPSHVTDDLLVTPRASETELRERMSGNICRCAAYPNIIAAIAQVAGASA